MRWRVRGGWRTCRPPGARARMPHARTAPHRAAGWGRRARAAGGACMHAGVHAGRQAGQHAARRVAWAVRWRARTRTHPAPRPAPRAMQTMASSTPRRSRRRRTWTLRTSTTTARVRGRCGVGLPVLHALISCFARQARFACSPKQPQPPNAPGACTHACTRRAHCRPAGAGRPQGRHRWLQPSAVHGEGQGGLVGVGAAVGAAVGVGVVAPRLVGRCTALCAPWPCGPMPLLLSLRCRCAAVAAGASRP